MKSARMFLVGLLCGGLVAVAAGQQKGAITVDADKQKPNITLLDFVDDNLQVVVHRKGEREPIVITLGDIRAGRCRVKTPAK